MQAKHTTILTIFILIAIGFVLGLNTLTGFFTLATGIENGNETSLQNQEPLNLTSYLSFSETRDNNPDIPINWFWNPEWNNKEKDLEPWDTSLISLDKEITHSGKKSLKHYENSHGSGFAIISRNFKIESGKIYRIEFFIKTNATGWNGIPGVSWVIFDNNNNDLTPGQEGILLNSDSAWEVDICEVCGGGDTFNINMTNDDDWKKVSFDFKPYGDAHHAMLVINMFGEGLTWAWWYMNDFSVREL